MDDRELVERFEACTLAASEFSHRNHVRLAWIYLNEAPLLDALRRFATNLERYATSLDASAKYHETITCAYLFLIHERMQQERGRTFDEFAVRWPELFENVLERYYSAGALASDVARKGFVMPDLVVGYGLWGPGASAQKSPLSS